MRKLSAAVLIVAMACVLALAVGAQKASAAQGCIINIAGIKICGELLGQPLPELVEVTVTAPPIRLPGPTQTITVRPQPGIQTVPGPTVTLPPAPQPTRTVTVTPRAEPTGPVPTVTATTTVTPAPLAPTGQPGVTDDIVRPQERDKDGFFRFDFDPFDDEFTAAEAGVGLLTILALVALMLAAMYSGYVLGYKDRERKDTDFMRALLERSKTRGQHR